MTRAVAFLAAALLAATLGAAQNSPTGVAAGSQLPVTFSGQTTTVTGCLSSSSLGDNHFNLTDEKGNVYSLAGLTDQLTSHAGQEVRITGIDNSKDESNSNATTPQTQAPDPSVMTVPEPGATLGSGIPGLHSRKSLQVTAVQKLADHCSSTGSKPEGADAQISERPSAQVKLISYKNVGAIVRRRDSGRFRRGRSSTQIDAAAQNTTPDQAGTNDLPRTATALPLLGILGLGSLVAGFIVRR